MASSVSRLTSTSACRAWSARLPRLADKGGHFAAWEQPELFVEGLLEYQVEGRPPVTLKAGEVLFIPAGRAWSEMT